ncbi:Protein BRICK1 [Strongyloides ratti]|uniref:Protein BRICK1 n=1 Tax=Strongyloides ratti TaxID=34506 RepID=A0A090N0H0_STRRB|nr:Protein BRICK1 [Strongyloides ratti]CEF70673.1 Protein BRICK1 [Strongyloides ratti]
MNPSLQPTSVQKQLKEDWDNRLFIQVVSDNIKSISSFLAKFELSCRSKLADLNDKICIIEKKVEFLEASVSKRETLN